MPAAPTTSKEVSTLKYFIILIKQKSGSYAFVIPADTLGSKI